MGLLTTNHFCCCFSLRTGGLVVGYFGLITAVLGTIGSIAVQSATGVQMNLPCLILSSCWLYGIHERKPAWLLLNVVLCIFNFMLFVFAFVICTGIILFFVYFEIYPRPDLPDYDLSIYLSLYTLFALVMVFKWHLTSATFSLYKTMKAEEANRNNPDDSYFIANLTQQFQTIKCKPMII